jgi:hypothetical protein
VIVRWGVVEWRGEVLGKSLALRARGRSGGERSSPGSAPVRYPPRRNGSAQLSAWIDESAESDLEDSSTCRRRERAASIRTPRSCRASAPQVRHAGAQRPARVRSPPRTFASSMRSLSGVTWGLRGACASDQPYRMRLCTFAASCLRQRAAPGLSASNSLFDTRCRRRFNGRCSGTISTS